MNVLCVDVDGLLPNLALMKLSAYHKQQGDKTDLLRLTKYWWKHLGKPKDMRINPLTIRCDKAYISCIFSQNRESAFSLKAMLESFGAEVEIGGVGIDLETKLPYEVEHIMPDYELYPNIDYSLGYTTRGCIRNCPWCVVPKKEGSIHYHADLEEFLHPHHRKVILLDNNLLAADCWQKVLEDLIIEKVKVCFTQGLDIRLLDDEKAKWLRLCKYYDHEWKRPRLYFSFDLPEIEEAVVEGIRILKKHGILPIRILVYTLVGFGVKSEEYTWDYFMEKDYHRFEVLRDLGALPFIMLYDNRQDIPLLKHFRRWVNRHLYESFTFKQYLKHEGRKTYEQYKPYF